MILGMAGMKILDGRNVNDIDLNLDGGNDEYRMVAVKDERMRGRVIFMLLL